MTLQHQAHRILRVACELAPVSDNPGLFWIGWARPLADADFRQLRCFMLCWRTADLDRNGLEGLDEGWRVTGEGLERAAMLGYQIFVDGVELRAPRGDFQASILDVLESRGARQARQGGHQMGQAGRAPPGAPAQVPPVRDDTPPALAPLLVRFLRPEGAIMGADLRVHGPFAEGEVAPVPYVHACIFIANVAAEIFG